jgi:quercetin dioxygenase-like cupin family protein
MNPKEFEAYLTAEGYDEIATVDKPAGYEMGEHRHAFDACALITAGEISLLVEGISTPYPVGGIFRIPAGTPHHENAPSGVTYIVGRRQVTLT